MTRLGGFHLLRSFLGSIGEIMADTGLEEMIQLVYPGSNTAEHILSGRAYAKSIRFHLLASAAIAKFVLKDVAFSEQEYEEMENFIRTAKEVICPFHDYSLRCLKFLFLKSLKLLFNLLL